MGNFVLAKALEIFASEGDAAVSNAFHHIALAAPDINAETFRKKIAPKIRPFANRYTVYASKADLAMDASREASQWLPLGDISSESPLVGELPFVDLIDATEVSKKLWFGVGHAYYGDMPEVIAEMLLDQMPVSIKAVHLGVVDQHLSARACCVSSTAAPYSAAIAEVSTLDGTRDRARPALRAWSGSPRLFRV